MISAIEAAALLRDDDSLGIPLGPGQPPAFMAALGERDDWTDLRVYGSHLAVDTDLFSRPGVHYLSTFFAARDRALRDAGANISFAPSDFRRFATIYEARAPRVMCTAAAAPDEDGWCSLSLHAGGTVRELLRAAADPDRILVVEASPRFPRTFGIEPDHPHRVHVDEIDVLIESDAAPEVVPVAPPTDVQREIARNAAAYVTPGSTIQTGIGAIPSMVATLLAEGGVGDLGIHSEVFTDGLMKLHEAGAVSNRKGTFEGRSVTTFALGSADLYRWLDGNEDVAFLPVDVVNSPEVIARNRRMVSINGAIAVDVHGQVVADTVGGRQYSGIGGHEDFAAGVGLVLEDRSLLCLPSTATVGGAVISRIVPCFERGTVITTPRHQVDVVVTEFGAAELAGRTVHQRGMALAAIAHPAHRDEIAAAAERASHGNAAI